MVVCCIGEMCIGTLDVFIYSQYFTCIDISVAPPFTKNIH